MARQGARRRGGDLPAALRGAGDGRSIDAQQEQRHARFFGDKSKAATGGQIELAHRAPAFDDHCTQRRAAQCIDCGAQQGYGIG